MMRVVGNITLYSSSDLEIMHDSFENQLLDISPDSRSGRIGSDGRLYVTSHPRNVIWYGGTVSLLRNIVHVKIDCGGYTVVDDDVSADAPGLVTGGISFDVKPAAKD